MNVKGLFWLGCFCISQAWAVNCDLYQFHWSCQLPAQEKPHHAESYLVYCRSMPVYVSRESYEQVIRYRRANVNMDLMVNDIFVEGPCIPGRDALTGMDDFHKQSFWKDSNYYDRKLYK